MRSLKVKFRPSKVAGREGTIYYQIIHERISRLYLTDYHIFPNEWDDKRHGIISNPKRERHAFLKSLHERIQWDIKHLNKILRKFDDEESSYSWHSVIEEFNHISSKNSLFNFMQSLIEKLKYNGKVRTSETYKAALNSFKKFRKDEDIMLDSLNSEIMEAYEAWHHQRGVSPNTISFYTRILRAVYNRAVEEELTENRRPFRHVYTGVGKTVKRALPLPIIRKIKDLDLSFIPELEYARDMFMMSFMLRGMSFIDMAYLRKTDLTNGYLTYRRRKTGQQLTIEWTKEMQILLDKYHENNSDYLLPIIRNKGINERSAYRNAGYNINHNLKRVANKIGISIPLTLYVARHSWASIAKSEGIPLSIISEGLGHEKESTTRIYLSTLDTTLIDRANSKILGLL
ncbi:MAG: site-specific integrase [Muribaculaceae bacterium]|nr:site-specific integrase [Muribaculaceae bacterium]